VTEQEYLDLLLDKLGGMPGKRTDGAKIIRGFSKYYDEKQQFVKNYNWQHITTAIDIGTGIGILPWMLMQKGISVEATEIDYELKKPNGTYKKCCSAIDLKVHSMYVNNNVPMNFPGKYDILVANRTMFDREALAPGEIFNWKFFLNDAFQYVDHVYIKTNIGSKTPPGFTTTYAKSKEHWLKEFVFKNYGKWHIKISKDEFRESVIST
tara:strand:+ start:57 stop:683 length:627 start_codon:yes stop_codon:yes gene_type:complete